GGTTFNNLTNTGVYTGATSATLSISNATGLNGNQYQVIVSGTCAPAATSAAATLTVNTAPQITVQPSNSTVCAPNGTSFSVTANGTALTYQWQLSTDG